MNCNSRWPVRSRQCVCGTAKVRCLRTTIVTSTHKAPETIILNNEALRLTVVEVSFITRSLRDVGAALGVALMQASPRVAPATKNIKAVANVAFIVNNTARARISPLMSPVSPGRRVSLAVRCVQDRSPRGTRCLLKCCGVAV